MFGLLTTTNYPNHNLVTDVKMWILCAIVAGMATYMLLQHILALKYLSHSSQVGKVLIIVLEVEGTETQDRARFNEM